MRNVLVYALFLLVFSGCLTTKNSDMTTKVVIDQSDGINSEEAVEMAKKRVLSLGANKAYDVEKPRLRDDWGNLPHRQDYWFVAFEEIKASRIPSVYLIIIDKDSGKVVFSNSYVEDHEWMLEAAILRVRGRY